VSTDTTTKPRASSTTSKVAATGAGISIAAIIGLWSQVAPVIEQVKPIIHQFSPDSAKKIDAIQDDIKKIDPLIKVITDKIKVIEDNQQKQFTPQPKPEPTPVDPPSPTPSPDQQRIADMEAQIRKLLDEIAKKHEPPPPVPVPAPVTSLKVLDSTGKELTQPIEAGRQFKVASTTAGKWAVTSESPTTDYDVTEYPDHLVCVLRNGAKLSISHATESPLTLVAIIVRCQDAPRPPPRPDDSEKHSSKPRKLFIAVVEDVRNRSPETATTLSDLEAWNSFRDNGHEWRFYDASTQETRGMRAVQSAKTSTFDPPQIVIHDAAGTLVFTGPLPNMAGVSELIARLEAGK